MSELAIRFGLAVAAMAAGGAIGAVLRPRVPRGADSTSGMPAGLYVVTAPFCSRCRFLSERLDELGIEPTRVDVRDPIIERLHIRTAPSLVVIDRLGGISDSETRDFSHERLNALSRLAP